MPDPTLNEAIMEAYASTPSVIVYDTLEFLHSLNTPIRVVRGFRDISAYLEDDAPQNPGEQVTFTAYPFEITRPETSANSSPELQLTIDNVSLEFENFVNRTLVSQESIAVLYRAYVQGDLTAPANSPVIRFDIFSISTTNLSITARARVGNYSNIKFPRREYNAREFPGLP